MHDAYAALRLRNFRLFVLARFVYAISLQVQMIALSLQVYDLTHDPLSLGMLGLAEVVPNLVVALYGGYVSDRVDRKKILLTGVLGMVICSIGFLVIASRTPTPGLVTLIYGIVFLTGMIRGFMAPANFSFFTQLIPKELYSNAAAWNSTAWQVSAVSGPALGGLLYALSGPALPYWTTLIMLGVAFWAFWQLPASPVGRQEKLQKESLLESLREGVRFVFGHPIILGAISLDLFAVLLGGAEALMPVFAEEILHVGKLETGILRAAPAAGAVAMALYLAHHPPVRNSGKIMLGAVAGFGLAIALFGWSQNYWLSLAALMFTGVFDNVSVVIRTTILQSYTPDEMRGRVSSVNSMFVSSSNELGAFESGVMAKWLGPARAVIIGGFLTVGVVALAFWRSPSLRRLQLGERK